MSFEVPNARKAVLSEVCPAGHWPASITAVTQGPDEQYYLVKFTVTAQGQDYSLEKVYPWDDAGKAEFGNLCIDAGLSGTIEPSQLVGKSVVARTRTRGGRTSAFIQDTEAPA